MEPSDSPTDERAAPQSVKRGTRAVDHADVSSWPPPDPSSGLPAQPAPAAAPSPVGQAAPAAEFLRYPVVTIPHGVKPAGGLGTLAQVLAGGVAAVFAAVAVVQIVMISVAQRAPSFGALLVRVDPLLDLEAIGLVLGLALLVASGIVNLVLLYRLAANGAKLIPSAVEHKSHWAVTGWFVPIMNLFRPYQMVKQIWRSSASADKGSPQTPLPELTKLWFGLLIAANIADRLVPGPPGAGEYTVDRFLGTAVMAAIANGVLVAAGVTWVLVLRSLLQRQDRGIAAPYHPPAPAAPPPPPTSPPPPPIPV